MMAFGSIDHPRPQFTSPLRVRVAINDDDVGPGHGTLTPRRPQEGGFLQVVQKIRRVLRMRCRAECCPLVVLQDLDSRRDTGGVVFANLRRKLEVGAKGGGARFGKLS